MDQPTSTIHRVVTLTAAILLPLLGLALWSAPTSTRAHLDPPGPPAFLERIDILSAVVSDDTDPLLGGEIFLEWQVNPPPPHSPLVEGAGIRVPGLGTRPVSAPPAVNILPRGVRMWRMRNCSPLERPVNMPILFQDDDAPLANEDIVNVTVPAAPGINTVRGPNGFVTYRFDWIATPRFDGVCAGAPQFSERGVFGAPRPGIYAQLPPGASTSFTFTFTNTGSMSETVAFRVVSPTIQMPNPGDINPDTFIGLVVPADPSWSEIGTPGAGQGLDLAPGEPVDLTVFVTPDAPPPGYYELELVAGTPDMGEIIAQAHAMVQVPRQTFLSLVVRSIGQGR